MIITFKINDKNISQLCVILINVALIISNNIIETIIDNVEEEINDDYNGIFKNKKIQEQCSLQKII